MLSAVVKGKNGFTKDLHWLQCQDGGILVWGKKVTGDTLVL